MKILIEKAARRLTLLDEAGNALFTAPIALGADPVGPKEREGDGKTPEGRYFVCVKKMGKYGPSLGISYPSAADALRAGADEGLLGCIRQREKEGARPPWGSPLGGEIYIHGGGVRADWTAGCVALREEDARALYRAADVGTEIEILP